MLLSRCALAGSVRIQWSSTCNSHIQYTNDHLFTLGQVTLLTSVPTLESPQRSLTFTIATQKLVDQDNLSSVLWQYDVIYPISVSTVECIITQTTFCTFANARIWPAKVKFRFKRSAILEKPYIDVKDMINMNVNVLTITKWSAPTTPPTLMTMRGIATVLSEYISCPWDFRSAELYFHYLVTYFPTHQQQLAVTIPPQIS